MYSFNPIPIISDELLSGEEVIVPQSIQDGLGRLNTASRWMFVMYIIGLIFAFLTILTGLTSLFARRGSAISAVVSFLAFLFIGAATVVATVTFILYMDAVNNAESQFGVVASLGTTMFAFSWTATGASLGASIGFCLGGCCGTGERKRGFRRVGAMEEGVPPPVKNY